METNSQTSMQSSPLTIQSLLPIHPDAPILPSFIIILIIIFEQRRRACGRGRRCRSGSRTRRGPREAAGPAEFAFRGLPWLAGWRRLGGGVDFLGDAESGSGGSVGRFLVFIAAGRRDAESRGWRNSSILDAFVVAVGVCRPGYADGRAHCWNGGTWLLSTTFESF
ncbi:hypothetical protein HDK77DRAFT_114731 [Phyllosticta capitalensis]